VVYKLQGISVHLKASTCCSFKKRAIYYILARNDKKIVIVYKKSPSINWQLNLLYQLATQVVIATGNSSSIATGNRSSYINWYYTTSSFI